MAVQLHVRTGYSLLNSMVKITEVISKAKQNNYQSLAITDLNVMHGYLMFYNLCQKNGIKPLFGLEFNYQYQDSQYPLYIYASNDEGYANMAKLSSAIGCGEIITLDNLTKYLRGNVLVFPSTKSFFSNLHDVNELKQALNLLTNKFSKIYIALMNNDISYNFQYNKLIKQAIVDTNIIPLAFSEVFYLEKEDVESYRILRGISLGKTTSSDDLVVTNNRYFKSPLELKNLYQLDELVNTDNFAASLNVKMHLKTTTLPQYHNKADVDSKIYLTQLCKIGLKKRLNNQVSAKYMQRLNHELKIICDMHFEDYFLIVYDFILYARKHDIYVGPGRGSAAGSLVAYCLGITHIDPIKNGLLFERFLNPERISMPDIDTDFPDNRRDEVIQYVTSKYGEKHVAHIITFGTLKAKQVIRDVARVLEFNSYETDVIAKTIPNTLNITLTQAYQTSLKFRQKINSEKKYQLLYQHALKLEGLPRHCSTHAAGIVFSRDELIDILPCLSLDGVLTTQYSMAYLEKLGLIKMDFLGLRNLTIIDEIATDIKKLHPNFNILKIPLDDVATYKSIQQGDLLGIFQLESEGMRDLVAKVQPKSLNDIALTIALYRPGPMQNIDLFLQNRNHPQKIIYPVNALKNILEETSGIIIYQEQIMMIAQQMAGFSLAKADILRRAMSKKKANELLALKDDFIMGCVKLGYSKEDAIKVYELILKFALYGFNKSHSFAYGLVAYQLAYLKANYPLYFYKALLNSVIRSYDKTSEYIIECQHSNAQILGLSINYSQDIYWIENNKIRFPLSAIKGMPYQAIKTIIENRQKYGLFKDYYNCVIRLHQAGISKAVIEDLISAGALDEFNNSRLSMSATLDTVITYAKLENVTTNQMSISNDLLPLPEMIYVKEDAIDRAEKERAVIGFYLSHNPIVNIKKRYHYDTKTFIELRKIKGKVAGVGLVKKIKVIKTKNGKQMAFMEVQDETGEMDLAIMPDLYQSLKNRLVVKIYVYFQGVIGERKSVLVKRLDFIE